VRRESGVDDTDPGKCRSFNVSTARSLLNASLIIPQKSTNETQRCSGQFTSHDVSAEC
jgi:hypothetical protein